MAISEPYASASLTVSTIELSLVSGTSSLQSVTTDGVFQVLLDLNALANGDVFELRIKEKVTSAGTQRTIHTFTFTDAQGADNAAFASPTLILLHGWDVTLDRTAGADRVIPYSIRQVA